MMEILTTTLVGKGITIHLQLAQQEHIVLVFHLLISVIIGQGFGEHN